MKKKLYSIYFISIFHLARDKHGGVKFSEQDRIHSSAAQFSGFIGK